MKHPRLFPLPAAGLILIAAFAGLAGARGQATTVQLAPVVVTATRVPESSATVGTDVDVVSGADLARQQLDSLQDALTGIPSAPIFATGQAGAAASVFLRGANSDQTLFLVDGIRLNDANTDYGVFLGGARMFAGDRLEVALGPQSTLYGSEAVGGVVSLAIQKGAGKPSESAEVEAGSFGTTESTVMAQGAAGAWAYSVEGSDGHTDNDRINNAFDSRDLALRLDYAAGQYVSLGATLRGVTSNYGDPSDVFTDDPISHEREDNWLGTIFADVKLTQYINSRLTLGGQDRHYDALIDATAYSPLETQIVENRRGVIDWQNTIEMTAQNRLVAGLTDDEETTSDSGYGKIDRRENSFSFYGEDEWNPLQGLYLTGGLRRDDFDTFGAATTGRLTAALLLANQTLKLRGSYGTGFNAPSFLDLYGVDADYAGNPKLQPERSDGWDMGVDFYAPDGVGTLSATWFQTDFRNLIVDNFDVTPGTTENVGVARTRGLELAFKTVLAGIIQAKVAYTRMEADDLTDETPLLRRPRYQANADFWAEIARGFSLGAGAGWVGTRADVDPQTFDTVYDPTYAVVRAYAAWKITGHLTLKLRVENLLDRPYEPVDGYPALGRGYYGSAEWKF